MSGLLPVSEGPDVFFGRVTRHQSPFCSASLISSAIGHFILNEDGDNAVEFLSGACQGEKFIANV